MKKIVKNKKILICAITILILISLIVGGIFLFSKYDEEQMQNKEITNNYVAYIKINPSIKLEYSQTCKNKTCNEPAVTNYELVNDDAKNIYKDIDLLGNSKDLFQVLNLIFETAKENGIVFEKVDIYTDWNKIENYIAEKNEISETISFNIEITNKDDVNKKIETEENNIVTYNVSFDTNGGNIIESQVIKKDDKVTKPSNPTKTGYKFIEWQLDNKSFDFDTKINKDITLTAKWEKEENNNSANNKPNTNNTNNNSNNSSNSNNNNTNSDNQTDKNTSNENNSNNTENKNDNNSNIDNSNNDETNGQGEVHMPENYECYDEENEICATNLTKKPTLMACAKQMKDIKDKEISWTNSHQEYPLISDLPPLSSYNLLSSQLDPDKFNCITADGSMVKCYQYILRCKSSEDVYEELYTHIHFKEN